MLSLSLFVVQLRISRWRCNRSAPNFAWRYVDVSSLILEAILLGLQIPDPRRGNESEIWASGNAVYRNYVDNSKS